MFLKELHSLYTSCLNEDVNSNYKAQNLLEKIHHFHGDILASHTVSKKCGTVIYHKHLTLECAIRKAQNRDKAVDMALQIRDEVLNMQNSREYTTRNILEKAKCDETRPSMLVRFLHVLLTGSPEPTKRSRLVNSVADDIIYGCSRGRIVPSKHVAMALGMKSITGSRKVIEILNRFGHSVHYHAAEEMETEIAEKILDQDSETPDGIERKEGLCTGLAWDNYDEMNETLSGAGTLHDTVGICYQNCRKEEGSTTEVEEIETEAVATVNDIDDEQVKQHETAKHSKQEHDVEKKGAKKVNKRRMDIKETEIAPYFKKPKMKSFSYQISAVEEPVDHQGIACRDLFWMMSLSRLRTPMWAGWNSLVTADDSPQQRIEYMKNITLPPTRNDVVAKTLAVSQAVARECNEKYAIVHYDLAVAKPALQIQDAEKPKFDNVFICFGPFYFYTI